MLLWSAEQTHSSGVFVHWRNIHIRLLNGNQYGRCWLTVCLSAIWLSFFSHLLRRKFEHIATTIKLNRKERDLECIMVANCSNKRSNIYLRMVLLVLQLLLLSLFIPQFLHSSQRTNARAHFIIERSVWCYGMLVFLRRLHQFWSKVILSLRYISYLDMQLMVCAIASSKTRARTIYHTHTYILRTLAITTVLHSSCYSIFSHTQIFTLDRFTILLLLDYIIHWPTSLFVYPVCSLLLF